jgi:CRP/FNR family transcriptional regulator, cyclic AMP receptor protein
LAPGSALENPLIQVERKLLVKAKKLRPFSVKAFLSSANGDRRISKYRKNVTVFSQGEPADSVFFIQEGKVKVTVVSDQGKEAVVALHGKGDFFGEGCLTGQPLRMATVVAMSECVIMRLKKAVVLRLPRWLAPLGPGSTVS